jgi:uncharacterized RDD family membrane protein YckC
MDNRFDVSPLQSPGARCAQHVEAPAAIICSRCGSYACSRCRQWGPDGADYCATCPVSHPQELAERGSRFVANLVDQFLLLGPWFVAGVVSAIVAGGESGALAGGGIVGVGSLLTLGLAGLQLYLVAQSGQSIGKRMVGIKVTRTDGSPASLGRIIFLRNLIPGAIGSMCGVFGIVDAAFIFNEDRCCLHDKMADTIVVKADGSGNG